MSYRSAFTRLMVALMFAVPAAHSSATEAGWALLREGGQVVLVNEAYSLATGRHPGGDIGDCRTQQTLSERGRQQAGKMGALFYARSAPVDLVLTSRNCRAQETAQIAFRDSTIEIFDALNEFVPESEDGAKQIEETIERVRAFGGSGNLIMVTHPANIKALTGVSPRPGEAIVLLRSSDTPGVAARITFN